MERRERLMQLKNRLQIIDLIIAKHEATRERYKEEFQKLFLEDQAEMTALRKDAGLEVTSPPTPLRIAAKVANPPVPDVVKLKAEMIERIVNNNRTGYTYVQYCYVVYVSVHDKNKDHDITCINPKTGSRWRGTIPVHEVCTRKTLHINCDSTGRPNGMMADFFQPLNDQFRLPTKA